MNPSIYPVKTIRTEIIIMPKENILKPKRCYDNIYTNFYIKHKNFIDSTLEKIKTSLSDYNKVKIYKGYLYLKNGYEKIIKLEDNEIFSFFEFLINKKEINPSRLLIEWNLYNISIDITTINKRVDIITNNLNSLKNLK